MSTHHVTLQLKNLPGLPITYTMASKCLSIVSDTSHDQHNGPTPSQLWPHTSSSPPLSLLRSGLAERQPGAALVSLSMLHSSPFDKLLSPPSIPYSGVLSSTYLLTQPPKLPVSFTSSFQNIGCRTYHTSSYISICSSSPQSCELFEDKVHVLLIS